jgi:TRAP-type mannitol/chloroaromatic compound transport system permease small subunit
MQKATGNPRNIRVNATGSMRNGRYSTLHAPAGGAARTRAIIDLAGYTVLLPLTIWLTLYLFRYLWSGWAANEKSGQSAFNMPVWPFRVVFFVAFLLLALQILAEVIKTARALRAPPPAGA